MNEGQGNRSSPLSGLLMELADLVEGSRARGLAVDVDRVSHRDKEQ